MFDEIDEKLRDIIARNLKVDKSLIQQSSTLADWGGDSLDFIETLFAIETSFDISLHEIESSKSLDFKRLSSLVKEALAVKAA